MFGIVLVAKRRFQVPTGVKQLFLSNTSWSLTMKVYTHADKTTLHKCRVTFHQAKTDTTQSILQDGRNVSIHFHTDVIDKRNSSKGV